MIIQNTVREYHSDSHTKWSCQYHIIFCPKFRRKVLVDGIDSRLKQLIIEKQKDFKYSVIEMEVMPDHVHLLLEINPSVGPHLCIRRIKGYTSKVLREEFPSLKSRLPTLWTHGKFISTVGTVSLDVVKSYIENQKGR